MPAPPGREGFGDPAGLAPVHALPVGAGRSAPVDVPAAPAFDAASLDGLAPFGAPPALTGLGPAPEPAPPTRTASGLVKRSPGVGAEQAPAAAMPDGELLANLSSITSNLPRVAPRIPPAPEIPSAPAARQAPRPTNPWTPPTHAERPGTSRSWPAPPDLGRPPAAPAEPGRATLPNRGGNGLSGARGPADAGPVERRERRDREPAGPPRARRRCAREPSR